LPDRESCATAAEQAAGFEAGDQAASVGDRRQWAEPLQVVGKRFLA